jgi:hypothetical protein
MANIEAIVQEGIAAVKAGRKAEARRILVRATELDERNEQAWLWLSACVDTPEEQRICLENVLSINPANLKAQRGLEAIRKQSGPSAPPAPQPAASVSPFGDYDSNPYAGTGFDSNPYAGSSNDPAIGAGWSGFDTASPEAPAPSSTPTSVEWGSGGSAVHGSGRDAPQPSAEEYDSWVSSLQLGGSAPAADAPAGSGYDAGSSFDPLSGPFSASPSGAEDSGDPFGGTFGGESFGSREGSGAFGAPVKSGAPGPFEGVDDSSDPFGSGAFTSLGQPQDRADPFSAPPATTSAGAQPGGGPFKSGSLNADDDVVLGGARRSARAEPEPFASSSAQTSSPFGPRSNVFGGFTSFADEATAGTEQAEQSSGNTFDFVDSATMRGIQSYFKAIPDEIQVGAERSDLRLVLTIGVLGLLNMVSLGLLVLHLVQH